MPDTTPKISNRSMATLSLITGLGGAFADWQLGKARSELFKANRSVSEFKAESAIKRGQEKEARSRQETKALVGSQRAILAASGIRVDTGSAADVQAEAKATGEVDAMNIRINALREAYGYAAEGRGLGIQAEQAGAEGRARAADTFLTGSLRAFKFGRDK